MDEFPANNWLGYGLDMTTVTPFDVTAVAQAVKRGRQLIQVDEDDTRDLIVGGIVYKVPRTIAVAQDIKGTQGEYITYHTGTEAITSFNADASLSARYLAVSGDVSTEYAMSKSYRADQQYALYSFNVVQYTAGLRNYIDYINEKGLANRLDQLPSPFPKAPSGGVIRDYKAFFESVGSHVIMNTTYGSRFQLNVWASNINSEVNNKFSVSVTAEFNGINAGGRFDASVKNESQFKTFETYMVKSVNARGGDESLAVVLQNDPTEYDNYTAWTKTCLQYPDVMGFTTTPLWILMTDAANRDVRKRANDMQGAYNYITSHPQPYMTAATLSIESDWAEFGLLTPSAMVAANTQIPFPDNTVSSQTKITWGREHSHNQKRATIEFYIINDGSPVDFYISHGSDGGGGGKGRASVLLEGKTYLNDKLTDNNWNTMWFYQAGVSAVAEPSQFTDNHEARTWHHTLHGFLKERFGEVRDAALPLS